jgi:hypothetical protein
MMATLEGVGMSVGMIVLLTTPAWFEKFIAGPHNKRMRLRHPELEDVLTFNEMADRSGILP